MNRDKHTEQHVGEITDPYLGPVFMRIGCEWCGVQGRYDSKPIAQGHADKHNRKYVQGWQDR